MLKLLKHPMFTEMVTGFYVRVVCSNNSYRMCRVVTVSQAQTSYQIQASKGKLETRHQLVCAFGNQRKTIQLSLVSNQFFTLGEFNAYKKACGDQSVSLPTRTEYRMLLENQKRYMGQKIDKKEVDQLVQKRLETKIRLGLYSAISNIPYELSRLLHEIDLIQTEIGNF